ncbi:hypothetical protein AB1Y20_016850 [Prymnesium parvum]|uniref:tRNA-splicing endonuclease subunit Sen54 N-terminal domain-containing protein n=1 Tax=Prymnesium parvum TaxID=97485 RepID=A0AB34ID32_PRYPA
MRKERQEAWLRRLEPQRGRLAEQQCVAQWDPTRQLARVVQERGNELRSVGLFEDGELWLAAEEVLCLMEDGGLLLLAPRQPLSLHEAYELLLGTSASSARFAVVSFLHRAHFVTRPVAATCGEQQALLHVYHRRGYSRRLVEEGALMPLFAAAICTASEEMPSLPSLAALIERCAPLPVRLACVIHHQVVFLDVDVAERVHLPPSVGRPCQLASDPLAPCLRPPSLPPSPPLSPDEVARPGDVGVVIAGEDSEEDDCGLEAPTIVPWTENDVDACSGCSDLQAKHSSSVQTLSTLPDEEDYRGAIAPPPEEKLQWPSISVGSLSSTTLWHSSSDPVDKQQTPYRPASRMSQLQLSAETSLLRQVQQQTTSVKESLLKSAQSVQISSEFLNQSKAHTLKAQDCFHKLTEGLLSLRKGTCMGSLWEPIGHSSH